MFDTVFDRVTWDCHADGGSLAVDAATTTASTLCPMFDQAYTALARRPARARPAGEHAGGGDGRVRPHAAPQRARRPRPLAGRLVDRCFAGGGVRGGQVIGSSDALGGEPRDRPVSPAEVAATVYQRPGRGPRTPCCPAPTEGRIGWWRPRRARGRFSSTVQAPQLGAWTVAPKPQAAVHSPPRHLQREIAVADDREQGGGRHKKDAGGGAVRLMRALSPPPPSSSSASQLAVIAVHFQETVELLLIRSGHVDDVTLASLQLEVIDEGPFGRA